MTDNATFWFNLWRQTQTELAITQHHLLTISEMHKPNKKNECPTCTDFTGFIPVQQQAPCDTMKVLQRIGDLESIQESLEANNVKN